MPDCTKIITKMTNINDSMDLNKFLSVFFKIYIGVYTKNMFG